MLHVNSGTICVMITSLLKRMIRDLRFADVIMASRKQQKFIEKFYCPTITFCTCLLVKTTAISSNNSLTERTIFFHGKFLYVYHGT